MGKVVGSFWEPCSKAVGTLREPWSKAVRILGQPWSKAVGTLGALVETCEATLWEPWGNLVGEP